MATRRAPIRYTEGYSEIPERDFAAAAAHRRAARSLIRTPSLHHGISTTRRDARGPTTGKGAARTHARGRPRSPASSTAMRASRRLSRINTRELDRLLEHISAENTVVELIVGGKSSRTLIREIQRHPFKRADPARRLPGTRRRREGDGAHPDRARWDSRQAFASRAACWTRRCATSRSRSIRSNIPNHIDVDVEQHDDRRVDPRPRPGAPAGRRRH